LYIFIWSFIFDIRTKLRFSKLKGLQILCFTAKEPKEMIEKEKFKSFPNVNYHLLFVLLAFEQIILA
jgi:hypothetical protein